MSTTQLSATTHMEHRYSPYEVINSSRERSRTGSIVHNLHAQSSEVLHEELFPLPPPNNCPPRPLNNIEAARVETLSRLQFFLATAPTRWHNSAIDSPPSLQKFQLPNGENVSCVFWRGLFHITGTDVVRALAYRFEAFGRPVRSTKKWEEGVFSDLRNLKPGVDAALEEPKSLLLEFLFRNGCIRTQKKQKVFYWFSVPHDRLFLDALERDLKREKAGQEPTSIVIGEPAMSFRYDPKRTLFEQFAGKNPGLTSSPSPPSVPSAAMIPMYGAHTIPEEVVQTQPNAVIPYGQSVTSACTDTVHQPLSREAVDDPRIFKQSLLPGSSDYKRRRRTSRRPSSAIQNLEIDSTGTPPSDKLPVISRAWTSSPRLLSANPSLIDVVGPSIAGSPSPFRNYNCMYKSCGRSFKRLEHLKRHVRTHTNERPFICTACFRSFTRQDNLVQHSKTHQKIGIIASDEDDLSLHRDVIRRRSKRPRSPDKSDVEDPAADQLDITHSNSYPRSVTAPPGWINELYNHASEFFPPTPSFISQHVPLSTAFGLPTQTPNIITSGSPAYPFLNPDQYLLGHNQGMNPETSLPSQGFEPVSDTSTFRTNGSIQ